MKPILLITIAALLAAAGCKIFEAAYGQPTPAPPAIPRVSVPMHGKNADPAPPFDKSTVVISIVSEYRSDAGRVYVGGNLIPRAADNYTYTQSIQDALKKALADSPQKKVYLQASLPVEYGSVVQVLKIVRDLEINRVALLVHSDRLREFTAQLPKPPDPEADYRELQNPNHTGVKLDPALKVRLVAGGFPGGLGGGSTEDKGTLSDPSPLTQALGKRFQTAGNDRAVTIYCARATPYDDVMRLIDVVKGAGANNLILQLEDLP